MDFEYFGPTRYDVSSSDEDEAYDRPASPIPEPADFIVRIRSSHTSSIKHRTVAFYFTGCNHTLAADTKAEQVGVIYSPTDQPKYLPLPRPNARAGFSAEEVNRALSKIVVSIPDTDDEDGVVHVIASPEIPTKLQYSWVRAVMDALEPNKIVVVDTLAKDMRSTSDTNSLSSAYYAPVVMASVLVLGVAAAVLNYADMYKILCKHVRLSGRPRSVCLIQKSQADDLFNKSADTDSSDPTQAIDIPEIRNDISTSIYL